MNKVFSRGLMGLTFLLSLNAVATGTVEGTLDTIVISVPKGADQSQIFESLSIQMRSESCEPPNYLNCAYYDRCRCERSSPHGPGGGR